MLIKHTISFGKLFKKFRLKSQFSTLSEFGKALADEGFIYEDSILSRWQQGTRIPSNRNLLLTIIKIFVKRRGIISIKEANSFIDSAGQGYLTEREWQNLSSRVIMPSKLDSPRKILRFFSIIGKSKKILRSGWVRERIKNPESVAEHSFLVSVIAMIFADQIGVDKEKLIKMALVRGLGEVVTGDIVVERGNIIDIKKKAEKEQKEREGIKKIFDKIGQADDYLKIFDEMTAKHTLEAKVFWDFDNLEMAFQALEYEREQGKNLEEFFCSPHCRLAILL